MSRIDADRPDGRRPGAARLSGRPLRLAIGLVCVLLLVLSIEQSPIYRSNQHTKFLHGLARAGYGFLHEDWLANTTDGLPAFTWLVYVTYRYGHELVFYMLYIALAVLFFGCLYRTGAAVALGRCGGAIRFVYAASLAILASRLAERLGVGDFWGGLADQRVLGGYLEPANFGGLLLLAVLLGLRRRFPQAALAAACAGVFHPAYLLTAIVLILVIAWEAVRGGSRLRAVCLWFGVSLVLTLSTPVYFYFRFRPTTPEAFAESQRILAFVRIPAHSRPDLGLGPGMCIRLLATLLALWFARRNRFLLTVLAAALATGAVLTAVQLATGNASLALLAPWRISVFTWPLCAALAIAGCLGMAARLRAHRNALAATAAAALLSAAAYGAVQNRYPVFIQRLTREDGDRIRRNVSDPAYDFVQRNAAQGQLFLTPAGFKAFRLNSGVPQFVSWKSHPYRDTEVLEWKRRIDLVRRALPEGRPADIEALRALLRAYPRISHLMVPETQRPVDGWAGGVLVYSDGAMAVYKIRRGQSAGRS